MENFNKILFNKGVKFYEKKMYANAMEKFYASFLANQRVGKLDLQPLEYAALSAELAKDEKNAAKYYILLFDLNYDSEDMYTRGVAAVAKAGWDISRALKTRVVRTYDTLDALAAAYGISCEILEKTISRFNEAVSSGMDADFGKPILEQAGPVETPPFYAMRLWPKVHHVSGGVGINTRAQVINRDGKPIPGLYAAGEVVGGIHGANRLGSCAITECFVFGREAGRNAAR